MGWRGARDFQRKQPALPRLYLKLIPALLHLLQRRLAAPDEIGRAVLVPVKDFHLEESVRDGRWGREVNTRAGVQALFCATRSHKRAFTATGSPQTYAQRPVGLAVAQLCNGQLNRTPARIQRVLDNLRLVDNGKASVAGARDDQVRV